MAFITPTLPLTNSATTPPSRTSLQMSTTSVPPRVVPTPLPNVLVYDHCPFCVRVRYALGLKNVKYNVTWLLNDDAATPTSLVGRKIVPIFQPEGREGPAQMESLDICAAIDADARYGTAGLLRPATGRTDIAEWFDALAMPIRRLTRVRFSRAPLPEFVFTDARETYIVNHPLKEPESYEENWEKSKIYIEEVQAKMDELDKMIYSKECCTEGGVGYDDIDLFPRLRSLTIVKGLQLPTKVREYVEYQSNRTQVPLYDYCAM